MNTAPHPRTLAASLIALMLAAGLAGCAGGSGGGIADFGSYDEAKDAVNRIYEPEEHSGVTDLHLGMVHPPNPDNAEEGPQPIVFLLFDALTDEPVTDATVSLESRMPAMGHGTSEEQDPTHEGNGVYLGQTNHIMPGEWVVDLQVTIASTGETFQYEIPYTVNQ